MAPATLKELTGFMFLQTWLKLANNLTRFKVDYDETTGLYFMGGDTQIGYKLHVKVGRLDCCRDVDEPTKRQ